MMQVPYRYLCTFVAVLAFTAPGLNLLPLAYAADSAIDILGELRQADQLLLHIYVETNQVIPPSPLAPDSVSRRDFVRFTRNDKLIAIKREFRERLPGTRISLSGPGQPELSGQTSVPLFEYYIRSGEISGMHRVVGLEYNDSGDPKLDGETQVLRNIYTPDDQSLFRFLSMPQWALGRGFAAHILSVDSVDVRDDGSIVAIAKGFYVPQMPGTWTLVIEPDTSFLVRDAQFTANGGMSPMFRIATSGTIDGSASHKFAEHATFTEQFGGNDFVNKFEHTLISEDSNDEFYNEVERVFNDELKPRSMVVDARGKSEVTAIITSPQDDEKQIPLNAAPGDRQQLLWKLFLGNLLLFGVLLLLWGARRTIGI
ncbi:hypothetical protein SH668x_000272 [Planctomicrobium sp. SH668]|uniref:hypothetical protein n=1 Tax=Planctomicrobium sp. SH668 TaxID=3448126 RepID=UPI003F5B33E2